MLRKKEADGDLALKVTSSPEQGMVVMAIQTHC